MEEFKKLTLVTELFEKEIMSKAKISDQDLKDYYDKHKEEFTPTIQIKASHILVKTEDEAKKVLARLKKGEKFGDIAKAVSIDTGSAKNGGDLGYFSKGQMVPEFEKAAKPEGRRYKCAGQDTVRLSYNQSDRQEEGISGRIRQNQGHDFSETFGRKTEGGF